MTTVADIPHQSPDDRTVREKLTEVITELAAQEAIGDANTTEIANVVMGDVAYTNAQTLTDNTAFDLCTIPVPDENGVCVKVEAAVFADDGTDHQIISILAHVNAVNKGGTVTAVVTEGIADVVADSASGTLTLAVAAAEGDANILDISVTANSSLTPTTFKISWKATVIYSTNGDSLTKVNANA